MTFIEYPKALYRGGVYVAVSDREEEGHHRDSGYMDWHADQTRMIKADNEVALKYIEEGAEPDADSADESSIGEITRRRGRPPKLQLNA